MPTYRFPKDSYRSQDPSHPKFEGRLPDYVYIEDKQESSEKTETVFQEGNTSGAGRSYPIFFRFTTLLVACVMTIWTCVLLTATILSALGAVLIFWRSEEMGNKAANFWKRTCKMSAISLASFVATLSPAFGLGIAALYFAQRGEKKPAFFGRFF